MLGLLRFVVGLIFLEHGTSKLFGFPHVASYPAHLPPLLLAAGCIEFVCGTLVCLGILTRPAAFLASGEMAVGYFMAHAPRSPFPVVNGGDAAILYCFVFLYLVLAGAGRLGLGRLLFRRNTVLAD
ncbi:MAG TPA: DoxX family protein [Acetobacteraceae bacterium]|nr:DoxX family protein [Acetobacteraceae bacterium]